MQLQQARHARRSPPAAEPQEGAAIFKDGQTLISFASNDYLGLARCPEVMKAAAQAAQRYGAGAGASRLISGNHPLYDPLEQRLAAHRQTEAACVFGSGYLANLGVIPALMGSGDLILMDKLAHACMLDGARLSGANLMRFAHNNLDHLHMLLEANRAEHHHCLIATESIFSMDGDAAPLTEIAALAERYDAWVLIDSAHDLYQPSVIRYPSSVIQLGTLSKALGAYGGYVAGSKLLIDYLKTTARSLIFSTALPPATIAGALAALDILEKEPARTEAPLAHARRFAESLKLNKPAGGIVPLVLGDNERALAAANYLEQHGFWVPAIRPPTVPAGSSRLRFAFSALHQPAQVDALLDALHTGGWV
ncbi:MAG: 8-amino-7-oxononanoate synthase [Alphaproteobacteria bacterium]|nr:8-amino-7-oxononanoate synthase [Alphaproteobacteria bacterium]